MILLSAILNYQKPQTKSYIEMMSLVKIMWGHK